MAALVVETFQRLLMTFIHSRTFVTLFENFIQKVFFSLYQCAHNDLGAHASRRWARTSSC